jgi:Xaa-Pro aminopeptidase
VGKDYQHGTGHGVGYYLGVHEGPVSISKVNKTVFKAGMIVSN